MALISVAARSAKWRMPISANAARAAATSGAARAPSPPSIKISASQSLVCASSRRDWRSAAER